MKAEVITLGSGCFWCVEAVFQRLEGVLSVVSGYAGGQIDNPTYQQVCSGQSGHAEVIQVTFDPSAVSVQEVLEVFWKTHDPTTLNRQGNDVGTQYRSVIFYHTGEQKQVAEELKKERDSSGLYSQPIVTEISPFPHFYPAEDYHQNYFNSHASQPYCMLVIHPKLKKFEKQFPDKAKDLTR